MVLLIIRCHIDISLRQQYIKVDDHAQLWDQLYARFHHAHAIFLPQAYNNWINLRIMDFPYFLSFNVELHWITAQFRLCDDRITDAELIDKTLSTFPPATAILS